MPAAKRVVRCRKAKSHCRARVMSIPKSGRVPPNTCGVDAKEDSDAFIDCLHSWTVADIRRRMPTDADLRTQTGRIAYIKGLAKRLAGLQKHVQDQLEELDGS